MYGPKCFISKPTSFYPTPFPTSPLLFGSAALFEVWSDDTPRREVVGSVLPHRPGVLSLRVHGTDLCTRNKDTSWVDVEAPANNLLDLETSNLRARPGVVESPKVLPPLLADIPALL